MKRILFCLVLSFCLQEVYADTLGEKEDLESKCTESAIRDASMTAEESLEHITRCDNVFTVVDGLAENDESWLNQSARENNKSDLPAIPDSPASSTVKTKAQ